MAAGGPLAELLSTHHTGDVESETESVLDAEGAGGEQGEAGGKGKKEAGGSSKLTQAER